MSNKSFVVLISGRGSNLQAIIDAIHGGNITGTLRSVISNRANAEGLQKARAAGVPVHVLDTTNDETREQYDARLIKLIDSLNADFVVLAGFMRLLSASFIEHYCNRILNIHPSLLPEFKGLHTHRRVLEAGKQEHGASVHFVNIELDSGEVVLQSMITVDANDDERTLTARVLETEHLIYPIAIQWYIEGRLKFKGQQLYFDNQPLTTPHLWKDSQLISSAGA